MIECRLIGCDEFVDRQKVGRQHGDQWAFIDAGMIWLMPWVYDHQDPDLEQYRPSLIKALRTTTASSNISIHYLMETALLRDPIGLMMPSGAPFYPESRPKNHSGWIVTGKLPKITIDRPIYDGANMIRYTIKEGIIAMTQPQRHV